MVFTKIDREKASAELIEFLGCDPDGRRVKCGDCEEWTSLDDAVPFHDEETVRCPKCAGEKTMNQERESRIQRAREFCQSKYGTDRVYSADMADFAAKECDDLRREVVRRDKMLTNDDMTFQLWVVRLPDGTFYDNELQIDQFAQGGKWSWFDDTGKVMPNAPLFDTALEAFEALCDTPGREG
jgi:hypothetical protein